MDQVRSDRGEVRGRRVGPQVDDQAPVYRAAVRAIQRRDEPARDRERYGEPRDAALSCRGGCGEAIDAVGCQYNAAMAGVQRVVWADAGTGASWPTAGEQRRGPADLFDQFDPLPAQRKLGGLFEQRLW